MALRRRRHHLDEARRLYNPGVHRRLPGAPLLPAEVVEHAFAWDCREYQEQIAALKQAGVRNLVAERQRRPAAAGAGAFDAPVRREGPAELSRPEARHGAGTHGALHVSLSRFVAGTRAEWHMAAQISTSVGCGSAQVSLAVSLLPAASQTAAALAGGRPRLGCGH